VEAAQVARTVCTPRGRVGLPFAILVEEPPADALVGGDLDLVFANDAERQMWKDLDSAVCIFVVYYAGEYLPTRAGVPPRDLHAWARPRGCCQTQGLSTSFLHSDR
jgi:hypothetical protein